ncbi:Arc family DNA-binding protein [Rhizobium brockwellii]|uniref:Arc family DNA-binding protein n=1 Tax=Rhizobium brockwellii TaxID=3019932 RepID=UPI003F946003
MSEKEKYPSELAERFQIRLPAGLRDRIKAYAERHGRSMNTEIVRVLENEFPEPWPLERRMAELLEIVGVLKAGKSEAINSLLEEFEATVEGVVSGRVRGLSDDERSRIETAFEQWQEDQARHGWSDDPVLDQEEVDMRNRIGSTSKFVEPALRKKKFHEMTPEEQREHMAKFSTPRLKDDPFEAE